MGQAPPSASRSSRICFVQNRGGDAALSTAGDVEASALRHHNHNHDDNDDHDDRFCSGISSGCLPMPLNCFIVPFVSRKAAFQEYIIEEGNGEDENSVGVSLGQIVTSLAAEDDESPPDELVLTDVEDEDDNDAENDINDIHKEISGEEEGNIFLSSEVPDEGEVTIKETTSPPAIPDNILSRLVAVDCGMVTNRGPNTAKTDLRRVCIVNGHGHPILSALVRVEPCVTPYYSAVAEYLSGLLPRESRVNGCGDDLDLGVSAKGVKEEASRLLKGKIVVGHSVGGDLAVLDLWGDDEGREFEVRDTAAYAPFMRHRGGPNGRHKSAKLRDLVRERLKKDIQPDGIFHCCEEDAVAALDLYKSVWHEWEASLKASTNTNKKEKASTSQMQQMDRKIGEQVHSTTEALTNQSRNIRKKKKKKNNKGKNSSKCQNQPNTHNKTGPAVNKPRSQTNKKIKGKKKNKMNRRQKIMTKAQITASNQTAIKATTSFTTLYSAFPDCNHMVSLVSSLFCYPILIPMRIMHDISRLSREAIISSIHLVLEKSRGQQKIVSPPTPFSRKKKKKKRAKKISLRIHNWFNRVRKYFEDLFLLCHIFMETHVLYLSMLKLFGASFDKCWDTLSIYRANASLALGLVGLSLFRRKHPRNDYLSKAVFWVLGQYRAIVLLLSLLNFGPFELVDYANDSIILNRKKLWLDVVVDTISKGSLTAAAW